MTQISQASPLQVQAHRAAIARRAARQQAAFKPAPSLPKIVIAPKSERPKNPKVIYVEPEWVTRWRKRESDAMVNSVPIEGISIAKIKEICLLASLDDGRRKTTPHAVSIHELNGAGRSLTMVLVRQVAMYFCKRQTGFSLPSIGRHFNNRDHTTVLHAVRRVEALIDAGKLIMNGEVVTRSTEL